MTKDPNTKPNPPPSFMARVQEIQEKKKKRKKKNHLVNPPKTKSHYFVQTYDYGNGKKKCLNCGKFFYTTRSNKKYCSKECYLEGVKTTKAIWHQKRREHNLSLMKKYREEHLPVSFGTPGKTLVKHVKKYKCFIIKRELMDMNLLTLCLLSKERIEELKKTPTLTRRYKVHQDKVDLVVSQLSKMGLYDREELDLDFTPPKIDLEEQSIATSIRYQPLLTIPESESINPYSHTHKDPEDPT